MLRGGLGLATVGGRDELQGVSRRELLRLLDLSFKHSRLFILHLLAVISVFAAPEESVKLFCLHLHGAEF